MRVLSLHGQRKNDFHSYRWGRFGPAAASRAGNYAVLDTRFLGRLSFWTCAPAMPAGRVEAGPQNQHQAVS